MGMQPKFPLVVVKEKKLENAADLSKPYISNGKVIITMRFDLNWLKKQLGLDWKSLVEEDENNKDGDGEGKPN